MNAFATGPSRSNSLVAVSTGLLHHLNKEEVEAVIGHEVAHIANGDMVTLTLIQGVINTFVVFLSRLFANLIASQFKDNRHMIEFVLVLVMQIVFSLLGTIVVAYFSRQREYRADAGGARYSNRDNMISALKALGRQTLPYDKEDQLAAFKISGAQVSGLFRTHPPLEDRIARLQKYR
jgi:heat shock protein HtpX